MGGGMNAFPEQGLADWFLGRDPSMDITGESSTTRKIRGIRNLIKGGSPGEKDAAVEMLKRLSGPQLPPV